MAKKSSIALLVNYVLPSDNEQLKTFTRQYKLDMMEQVIGSIEYALANEMPLIEIFQFKNSDFVITIAEKDYLSNLANIFDYYMKREMYENCPRVVRLQKTLQEKSKSTDEKQER